MLSQPLGGGQGAEGDLDHEEDHQLTAAKVKHATAPGRYGDGAGLYLEISKGGGKSWVFMWKRSGKRRAIGLESARSISLVKARELAQQAAEAVVADRRRSGFCLKGDEAILKVHAL